MSDIINLPPNPYPRFTFAYKTWNKAIQAVKDCNQGYSGMNVQNPSVDLYKNKREFHEEDRWMACQDKHAEQMFGRPYDELDSLAKNAVDDVVMFDMDAAPQEMVGQRSNIDR